MHSRPVVKLISVVLICVMPSVGMGRILCKEGAGLIAPGKATREQVEEFRARHAGAMLRASIGAVAAGLSYIYWNRYVLGNHNFFTDHGSNLVEVLPPMAAINSVFQAMTGKLVLKHPWLVRHSALYAGVALNTLVDFQPHRFQLPGGAWIGGYDLGDFAMGLIGVGLFNLYSKYQHRKNAQTLGIDSDPDR